MIPSSKTIPHKPLLRQKLGLGRPPLLPAETAVVIFENNHPIKKIPIFLISGNKNPSLIKAYDNEWKKNLFPESLEIRRVCRLLAPAYGC